jgi:hypothetical protein
MRTIQISTDVFAALWAARRGDEQTEDEILRVLLKLKAQERPPIPTATGKTGFNDGRNGLRFPESFEIFRKYLGTEYRAPLPTEVGFVSIPRNPTAASTN